MLVEKVVNRQIAYEGKLVQVSELEIDFGNSHQQVFEIVTFKTRTGVSAVPITGDDVLLLKHFHAGIGEVCWSLPMGRLEEGEVPEERVQLELQEEIGYKAGRLTLMTRVHILPSYISNDASFIYLAEDLEPSPLQGDEPYPITVIRLPVEEALRMVQSGDITDARTAYALLFYWFVFRNHS
jgi:ADP-ribose diphosphatase